MVSKIRDEGVHILSISAVGPLIIPTLAVTLCPGSGQPGQGTFWNYGSREAFRTTRFGDSSRHPDDHADYLPECVARMPLYFPVDTLSPTGASAPAVRGAGCRESRVHFLLIQQQLQVQSRDVFDLWSFQRSQAACPGQLLAKLIPAFREPSEGQSQNCEIAARGTDCSWRAAGTPRQRGAKILPGSRDSNRVWPRYISATTSHSTTAADALLLREFPWWSLARGNICGTELGAESM